MWICAKLCPAALNHSHDSSEKWFRSHTCQGTSFLVGTAKYGNDYWLNTRHSHLTTGSTQDTAGLTTGQENSRLTNCQENSRLTTGSTQDTAGPDYWPRNSRRSNCQETAAWLLAQHKRQVALTNGQETAAWLLALTTGDSRLTTGSTQETATWLLAQHKKQPPDYWLNTRHSHLTAWPRNSRPDYWPRHSRPWLLAKKQSPDYWPRNSRLTNCQETAALTTGSTQ